MFKRFILAIVLVLICSTSSYAADTFKLNGLNIQGDILYLFSEGNFAVGAGTTIATIYDLAEIRGVFVDPLPDDVPNKVGVGIGVNLVKVINKFGGMWLIDKMDPSIGVTALTNLSGEAHLEPAVYLSAVNFQF